MRLVHISDTHWTTDNYPEADLYIFTGDHLRNFPVKVLRAYGVDWDVDPKVERIKQKLAMDEFAKRVGMRSFLGSPDTPVVCVRGNHDFVPIAPLFAGCNLIHEFNCNEVVEVVVDGRTLKITGHRGVPWIGGDRPGCWNDEMPRPELMKRIKAMDPSCDVFLTHYAPDGVGLALDFGMEGVVNWLSYERGDRPFLHCFGHIHKSGGCAFTPDGKSLFSNAATTYNVVEGNPDEGWKLVLGS